MQTTLLHWYLTRVVPVLRIDRTWLPNQAHRYAATISLRMLVHCGVLLPFRVGIIFFALGTLKHLSFT